MKQKIILIIKVLLFIFLLFIGTCYANLRIRRKSNGDKIFTDIVEVAKSKNVLIKKNDYKVKTIKCEAQLGHLACTTPLYGVVRKNYKYKSKYFDKNYNYYSFYNQISINDFNNEYIERKLKEIIKYFGLNFYILDEFIYDKSKGNDFEKIEEVLKSYEKRKIKYYGRYSNIYYCTNTIKKKLKIKEKK